MPYIEEIVKAGDTKEVSKYFSQRIHPKGCKRQKRKKKTRREQEEINKRKRIKKLRWILNENFYPGDMHIRLSYDSRKPSEEEMKKHKRAFLRSMRNEYRKRGKELKFVHTMEIGERGARHHHLIINSME